MMKYMSSKWMIGGLAVVVTAVGLSAYTGGGRKSETTAPQPASLAQIPAVIVTTVESRELNQQVRLPGELEAYQDTAIYAKVPGFVEVINVDRGSEVKQGQLLARLRAPELDTRRGEANPRVRATHSQRLGTRSQIGAFRPHRLPATS